MTTQHTPKKFLDIIGLLFIIPPAFYEFGWLNFDIPYLHVVLLIMSVLAILFCVKGFNQPTVPLRILSILVVIGGVVLALINLLRVV